MKAYVTLLTSEDYVPGALTLAQTLKQLKTQHKTVVLLDLSKLSAHLVKLLTQAFDELIQINDKKILAPLEKVAAKLGRKELAVTYTKLLLWDLDKYDQVMYLDADTLPLKNLDHVFDKYESLPDTEVVAAPDLGWPDIFNSGLLVLKPNKTVFSKLMEHSEASDASFDGADQGLLNEFFHLKGSGHTWKRLPFIYNVTPTAHYQYQPALTRFFSEIHLVHFIGGQKPWHTKVGSKSEFEQLWWDKFNSFYTEEHDRILLLSRLPSEGYNLQFTKLVNQWDEETPLPELDQLSVGEPSKIFPWEYKEKVEPTRVFNLISYDTKPTNVKPVKVVLEDSTPKTPSKTKPLNKAYNQFSGRNKFNPDKALEEVARIPLKFLHHKKK